MKYLISASFLVIGLLLPGTSFAAYESRPDIIEFDAVSSFTDGTQRVVLSWTTDNADGCQLREVTSSNSSNQSTLIKSVEADGVYVVTQTNATTYELYCTKILPDGFSFDSKEITVSTKKPYPLPTCTLSVKPRLLIAGERAKLSWKTRNAKEVRWQQDGAANVLDLSVKKLKKKGSESVTFAGKDDQTVTLLLKGKNGSTAWCKTTVGTIEWIDF